MPKRKSTPAGPTDTYDSDDGFVARDEDDDDGGARKNKKVKGAKVEKGRSVGGGGAVDKEGEVFWELTSKRRVGVTTFKGKHMVNIREYYEKGGEVLPGKKGISLPLDQFNALIKLLPHIETVLAGKGQSIERPDYREGGASAAMDEDGDEEDEEVEEKGKKKKKNFEETSDEE